MLDYMKFWFAKGLTEFLVPVGVIAAVFCIAVIVAIVKTYRKV